MKKLLLAALFAALSIHTVSAEKLRTADGEIYNDVKLKEVSHRGLVFIHSEGVITIKPDALTGRDKERFKAQIELHKKEIINEKKRVAAEKKRIADEKKQARTEAAKKQQQLDKRFSADVARIKKLPIQRRYEECRKLNRKYYKIRVNRAPLTPVLAEAKKQKLTAPFLTKNSELKLARAYALTLVAMRHQFAMIADPKSADLAKIKAQCTQCETAAFTVFKSMSLDEKIVILWKINSDIAKIQAMAAAMTASTPEEKAIVSRIKSAANAASAKMARAVYSYGFNAKEISSINLDENKAVSNIFMAITPKLLCSDCKARGSFNDKGAITLDFDKRKVALEACKTCGGLGVKSKL